MATSDIAKLAEIDELRAELVALKAPRPPQDYFASKQAPLLHELLHQVIHGDFMGDNQDDLNLALRARKQLEELCKSFEKLKGKKIMSNSLTSAMRVTPTQKPTLMRLLR